MGRPGGRGARRRFTMPSDEGIAASGTDGRPRQARPGPDHRTALARGLHGRRPDHRARGDRLRRGPHPGATAHRLDRRAGGRHLPAQATRRLGLLRLCRRAALVEEIPVSRPPDPVLDRGERGFVRRPPQPGARPPICLPGRPLVRPARHRDPGSGVPARAPRRPALPGASRPGVPHRGELWSGGGHVLLHEHEHRPAGVERVRPGDHRGARMRLSSRSLPTAAGR